MDTKDCAAEVTGVTQTCDDRLSSWMYWEYKPFNDITTSAGKSSEGFYNFDGSLEQVKVKALVRTYVKAAQGLITKMHFDTKTAVFEALIKVDTSINQPTVIFAHQNDT